MSSCCSKLEPCALTNAIHSGILSIEISIDIASHLRRSLYCRGSGGKLRIGRGCTGLAHSGIMVDFLLLVNVYVVNINLCDVRAVQILRHVVYCIEL